jgi:prolipoprotein diacylglyceryltransferase
MRYLTEDEQRWYGFVYGTGAGAAVLTVNSEQRKDGGAKEFADAVFHGGKTNLAGLV